MPHVIVKMYAGRSEAQKQDLADAVARAVVATLSCTETSVSVAIEDVVADRWAEDVYRPDILESAHVYKKPGYDPFTK
jgi:4-oxalocrotonate tautomerase